MDYKKTLNITLNDRDPGAMPQRGNLPVREVEIQAGWDAMDLYRKSLEKPAPNGTFILHDGPPYSNGDIHLGHALNKIAKDIIVKYRTMTGFRAPYVPGWDNHGMPIENNVAREFRAKGERPERIAMRKRCREYAAGWVERQKGQFRRLGVRGDWDHPYLTMSTHFESRIVEVFCEMARKGYVYRGLKPVLWCPACETALADAEVEYGDHTSNSIFVRFAVSADPNSVIPPGAPAPAAVIWTTTPWTIPANLALAVHPDAQYAWVRVGEETWLLAAALVDQALAAMGREGKVIAFLQGRDLEGLVARHPLFERDSPVVFADYVTMEDGTGVVHTAPGHGKEDFETGQRLGLPVLCPVGPSGKYTAQAGDRFEGVSVMGGAADARVLEALAECGALTGRAKISHSYPHCWRCHNPLIFRATVQWFMSIDHDGHRQNSLAAIERTNWFPPVSMNRISAMVAGRPDWCLSRQRAWGVGIPAFYCEACGAEMISPDSLDAVCAMVRAEGADAWYVRSAAEILPSGTQCAGCGGTSFRKESDILDVWFDSGSTHLAVLDSDEWDGMQWPADLYLEGSDQHRGWFNSSLMTAMATKGSPPYRSVITNGWTLDDSGKAMHKSLGNVVSPDEIVKQYGADILRLWVASTDYFEDVRCSNDLVKQVAETYRRIRNTFRFLVNNLYDFDPTADSVADRSMLPLDRWVVAELGGVVQTVRQAYDVYEFHRIYHAVHDFCAGPLSAFYLDVVKDRLYCTGRSSVERRSAQTALHALAVDLARILAPILSHTAEEVWSLLLIPNKVASVQLADYPEPAAGLTDDERSAWTCFFALREDVSREVETARQAKTISNPLEGVAEITVTAETHQGLGVLADDLAALLKVSQASLMVGEAQAVSVAPAAGAKCARCWLIRTDVGSDGAHGDLCGRCAGVVASLEVSD